MWPLVAYFAPKLRDNKASKLIRAQVKKYISRA
jgi:hypothetical protein